tara:strand:+ start:55192 stop:56316 length:1125 start_codon:yes stop_codon:yes gene_type:complete
MKKSAVLVFITNVDWAFVSHRISIALEAKKQGFEVHLVAKGTDLQGFLKEKGIIFHDWNLNRSSLNPIVIGLNIWQLFSVIKKIRPDLIHAITIKPILMFGISRIFLKPLSCVYAVAGLGHAFTSKSFKSFSVKILSILFFRLVFNKRNTHVIFQNNDDLKKISNISNLKNNKFSLIPGSGIDLTYFRPKKINNSKKIVVLFASRLLKSKGLFEFVNAAKEISNAEFQIAGKFDDGNDDCIKPEVINKLSKDGYITYLGMKKNMVELINSASIVVLPSFYGEGIPKILIEAAGCGKPIITTDHPGCRDAVIDQITGILIPPRNSVELKKAINYLINNPNLMKKMGEESRKFAEQRFNIKDVIDTHMEIYNKMLK